MVRDGLVPGRRQNQPLGREAHLDSRDGQGQQEETERVSQSMVDWFRVVVHVTLNAPCIENLQQQQLATSLGKIY